MEPDHIIEQLAVAIRSITTDIDNPETIRQIVRDLSAAGYHPSLGSVEDYLNYDEYAAVYVHMYILDKLKPILLMEGGE